MNRLYSLDYLRGMSAFGIMIFHYFSYTFGGFTADTFLCRIGTYGVGVFYILSGITLYYVYYKKIELSRDIIFDFFKKRIFRIFPLLWLATILTLILKSIKPDLYMLFLNLTGLFCFLKWDAYWAAGAWSIGNELVFYLFFPFFVLFSKYNKLLMVLLSILITSVFFYFAFYKIESDLNGYFVNYINPLNNIFLFLGGFLMGLFFDNVSIKKSTTIIVFLFSLILFIFYPVTGNRINLLIGMNRLIFTSISFLICFSFYKSTILLPEIINKPLTLLGEASYSVYLIHPIIYLIMEKYVFISKDKIHSLENYIIIFTCILVTLVTSYFIFKYFEKYFMNLSKKTTPLHN